MSLLGSKSSPLIVAVAASALFLAAIPGAFAHQRHNVGSGGGPFGTGPVHGPGSSHNPIVAPVVRDHRRPQPRPSPIAARCRRHWNAPYCDVRDHRTPPPIPCYGNLC